MQIIRNKETAFSSNLTNGKNTHERKQNMKKIIALALVFVMALALLAGCTSKDDTTAGTESESAKNPAVSDIYAKIEEEVGADNMPMFMDADDEMVSTYYYVSLDDIEEYVGKFPAINVKADEFFIVKAKDGKAETVKEGIEKRLEDLDAQWKQYLPEQYEYVKNAVVTVNGSYVLLAVGPNAETASEIFDAETK